MKQSASIFAYLAMRPGKGGGAVARNNAKRSRDAEATRLKRLNDWLAERFEVLESNQRLQCVMRCKACGHVFKRTIDMRHEPRCPECERRLAEEREHERELEHEQRLKRNVMQELVNLLSMEHTCPVCGSKFRSKYASAVYCSGRCKNKSHSSEHIKRAKKHGSAYEHGITLEGLIKRDGLTCHLCGMECDPGDNGYGSSGPAYPTIDHIIPISRGGAHAWSNIKVAHHRCNSLRGDTLLEELDYSIFDWSPGGLPPAKSISKTPAA